MNAVHNFKNLNPRTSLSLILLKKLTSLKKVSLITCPLKMVTACIAFLYIYGVAHFQGNLLTFSHSGGGGEGPGGRPGDGGGGAPGHGAADDERRHHDSQRSLTTMKS